VRAERDLKIAVVAAGHDEGQVVEDAFVEALPVGQAMRRGEIDARLPLLIGAIRPRCRRNRILHGRSPC
jgi:hypothetical protein